MTINQLKCVLAEMKRIYAYDEKKTEIGGLDLISGTHNRVEIHTVDELTGIDIVMGKVVKRGDYENESTNRISDPRTNCKDI